MHVRMSSHFRLRIISSLLLLALAVPPAPFAQQQQPQPQARLVEDVLIEGNRRLREDDMKYYIQTRPNEPYNEQQVQADLQTLLQSLPLDKTEARVLVEDGQRGGVNVIFEIKELPIIRDIQFDGLKSITEADVLKAFRENRIGISKESAYDPVKANNAKRVIRELLAARGHPNATIDLQVEEVSATSTAVTFDVNEGERVRVVEIEFEGNEVFSDGQLRGSMQYVKEAGLISRFKGADTLDRQKLRADLERVRFFMNSKGYLQARAGEPRIEPIGRRRTGFPVPLPLLSSTDDALRVTIPITEGRLYRIGEVKIEGNSIYSEEVIRQVVGLKPGDIANGERIGKALFEDLKKLYGSQGFLQYSAEPEPSFKDSTTNPKEGVADFTINIDEGKQFTLRRLEFLGNTFTRDNVLRREVLLNEGDVYNQQAFEFSVLRLNQLGFFDPIDKDKDADLRTNEEEGLVDINLKVAERGRQQISFNGGVSGIGGSFFGLDYSTSNLLGRGESLSLNAAFGNRQRSFVFSFTEPYIRNRPITVGFSLFTYSSKFFGQGSFLSQNPEVQQGLFGSQLDFLSVGEENLFTNNTLGASVFLSAPLQEFYRRKRFTLASRIGLSYSLQQSSVKDPEVNQLLDQTRTIPVIYQQSNILTSRITPTFVYDTRNASIDPTTGKQLAFSVGLAGLGGDVRTYSPSVTYTQFIPVRRKGQGQNPEVFGFRLLAAHIGSFGLSQRVREAQENSISFIAGVPVYERFFLGDEFTIRGYNVRSLGPYVPIETFITSRNVFAATSPTGEAQALPGFPAAQLNAGVFTGAGGSNPAQFSPGQLTPIGGDTQILGNFEYRVPIFGPVSVAAFADVGSAFNLRKGLDQVYSTNFLPDQTFVGGGTLTQLYGQNNPQVACSRDVFGRCTSLLARDARFVTNEEFENALRVGPVDPVTQLPVGFQTAYLRGEAQTNTAVRLSQSVSGSFTDFKSSLGVELRVQVPVVNVPFRLIYAYNPNADPLKFDPVTNTYTGRPYEKRSVFRFSIGRTF